MSARKPVFVTEPFLPPLSEYVGYLEQIWQSKTLTNGGPMHRQLEDALCRHLGIDHISLFTNGTIALITALQALRVSGQVITTPYSFVATAHSLLWNGLEPVFVDIDPQTLNLDPAQIEAAITPRTTAILPVHCYGEPCDVDAIQRIADRHDLKVVYDAAHAFGVSHKGRSVLQHGDLSVLSFHATKVFNTFEGGAIVSRDAQTKLHIDQLKNFGFVDETTVVAAGINGKMSEVNAAMGLLQLEHIQRALEQRKLVDAIYREAFADVRGIRCVDRSPDTNFAYFPILVDDDYPCGRDGLYDKLREHEIFARRYFYPLISSFPMYSDLPSAQHGNLPIATSMAARVLCLPIYPSLQRSDQERVIAVVRGR